MIKKSKGKQSQDERPQVHQSAGQGQQPLILLLGATGQVGKRLAKLLPELAQTVGLDRQQCDMAKPEQIAAVLERYQPSVIVNAAAYTAVDAAESEAGETAAYAVNADALAVIGLWAASHGALVFHYSTDYVFDGTSSKAYTEQDATNPLNVYGASKLAGEAILADTHAPYICMRTTWVYDSTGKNFVLTMLKLAQQRSSLSVVADQIGAPTSARQIAQVTVAMLKQAMAAMQNQSFISGVYHYSAGGETSWHGFAQAIFAHVNANVAKFELSSLMVTEVAPIATIDYPTPATRPLNSRLNTAKLQLAYAITPVDWQQEMAEIVEEIMVAGLPAV